jgi:hypothetical protein
MDAYQVISQYYDLEHDDFQEDVDFLCSSFRKARFWR